MQNNIHSTLLREKEHFWPVLPFVLLLEKVVPRPITTAHSANGPRSSFRSMFFMSVTF